MDRTNNEALAVAVVVATLLGVVATLAVAGSAPGPASDEQGLPTFESERAFVEYVQSGDRAAGGATGAASERVSDGGGDAAATGAETGGDAGTGVPGRVGTTNTQVAGVDEPDAVKAGAAHLYYAPGPRRVAGEPPRVDTDVDGAPRPKPRRQTANTSVIDIGSPRDPAVAAEITASGRLLRDGDRLVVLEGDRLVGYDVRTPAAPEQVWQHPLNGSLETARLADGRLYLVIEATVRERDPCPVGLLGGAVEVGCTDVHRPERQVPADATYTVAALDPADGSVYDTESVVGTRANTVVYADGQDLYLTYTERSDRSAVLTDFLLASETVPPEVKADIRSIRNRSGRGWGPVAERVQEWIERSDRDRETVSEELRSGLEEYLSGRKRALTTTGVVRLSLGTDVQVAAHGTVPGEPLNQFALDAHEGTLRIATTIPAVGPSESANDLYTLDSAELSRQGSVTGMGAGQRVYAVRYVGDTAYVITFRRVDPLHVVDLSDPAEPVERGTLELPGFSRYLHPIDDGHVLGIGAEDGRVKAVLFNVSEPTEPTVADDLLLDQGVTAVAESHHAFTIDRRHGVFFLPAGRESAVVDYTDGTVRVEARIETEQPATRARYVNDTLYVFAGETVRVLDEETWTTVATLRV